MTIDEVVASPEWLEAAEPTKREWGIDKPRSVKPNPYPTGPCLGMGPVITKLEFDSK